ncbi:probable RING finger protein 207 homolog [Mizuhopecten yessoensis]|uniref:probable RING finger protein 207 homolog n=1 Tax=Mizuhopecten yessoensis TaxID=6573 RepID=UPI000B45736E|nr:probable RING finger protein 207 homolog [Mizuhopecten yessoensis]
MASNRSLLRAQEPICHTCDLCDTDEGVRWYCNDCQENLCELCMVAHKRERKTKNDDVVSIWEANRQDDKPVSEECKLHPGKLCDMYCYDCDTLICLICLGQLHEQHNCTTFEYEFRTKKKLLREHKTAISARIEDFKNMISTLYHGNTIFTDNIDTMRKEVTTQRTKLKSEIDSIADALLAELSSLEKEEATKHKKDDQQLETYIGELTRLLEEAEVTHTFSMSMLKMERSLRKTLPLYDVNVNDFSPKQQSFVTGSIDRVMLTKMLGELNHASQYEKTDIDSKHVQCLSKFTITQQNQILGVCPVDDSHAWLSIYQYQGLVLVNREGMVKETVELDFYPNNIAMVGTTDILMTTYPQSTCVYKLSLHNKQVTKFADVTPNEANDVSINESGYVFVSTGTQDIVVLNQAGTFVREVTCEINVYYTACLSSGDVAVLDSCSVFILTDLSGTTKYKWDGELNNGQKVCDVLVSRISRDKYDRLFVVDYQNNQVYVLPRDSAHATDLLDQKHGVSDPTAVGVDAFGNVWIGCEDGTVHVMRL